MLIQVHQDGFLLSRPPKESARPAQGNGRECEVASGRIGAFKFAEPGFADWRLRRKLTVGNGSIPEAHESEEQSLAMARRPPK